MNFFMRAKEAAEVSNKDIAVGIDSAISRVSKYLNHPETMGYDYMIKLSRFLQIDQDIAIAAWKKLKEESGRPFIYR